MARGIIHIAAFSTSRAEAMLLKATAGMQPLSLATRITHLTRAHTIHTTQHTQRTRHTQRNTNTQTNTNKHTQTHTYTHIHTHTHIHNTTTHVANPSAADGGLLEQWHARESMRPNSFAREGRRRSSRWSVQKSSLLLAPTQIARAPRTMHLLSISRVLAID